MAAPKGKKAPLFEVEGVDQLRRELKAAGASADNLKEPLRQAARYVEETAVVRAPRDSGALMQSIRSAATQRVGIVRAGSKAVPYAGPLHWGWPARHIRPTFFVSIAARQSEPRWLPILEQHIADALDQVKGIS